jgi:hypothetical protein
MEVPIILLDEIIAALNYASEGRTNSVKPDLLGNEINRLIVRKMQQISDPSGVLSCGCDVGVCICDFEKD